jgi:O-antigen/teichoic acid export membrane protein
MESTLLNPVWSALAPIRSLRSAWDGLMKLALPMVGNVGAVVAGLLSLRVITGLTDSNSYGEAGLTLGLISLLAGIVSGPMLAAQLRASFQDRRQEPYRAGIRCALVSVAAYVAVATGYALTGRLGYLSLVLPAALLIVSQTVAAVAMNESERTGKYHWHAAISVTSRSGPLLAFMIPYFPWTYGNGGGVLLALALGPVVSMLAILALQQGALDELPSAAEDARGRNLSIVGLTGCLQAAFLAHWFLSTSDRYILSAQYSPAEVGIYVMNYGVWSMPLQMLNGSLETLFRRSMYRSAESGEFGRLWGLTRLRLTIGFGIGLLWLLALPWVIRPINSGLLGRTFEAPEYVVLMISLAHLFLVSGYALVALHLSLGEVKPIVVATFVGAGLCVAYDLVFIPSGGIRAAAEGTLVGYLAWCALLTVSVCRRDGAISMGLKSALTV